MHRGTLLTTVLTSLSWTTFAAANVETGACCVDEPVIGMHCLELTAGDCIQADGFYYGDGTQCGAPFVECPSAPDEEGACCWWDGTAWQCYEIEDYKCSDLSGTWYGSGVSCSDPQVVCPPDEEVGACCLDADGSGQLVCLQLTLTDCSAQNGYHYGNGVPCSDPIVECDEPQDEVGACCLDEDGSGQLWCVQTTLVLCSQQNGYFYGIGVPCSDPMVECHEPQGEEGACCMVWAGTLTCVQVNHVQCQDAAGTWYGYNVLCSDPVVDCVDDDDRGACCLDTDGDGQYWCVQLPLLDCSTAGGYFYGVGVSCSDPIVECPTQPTGDCLVEAGALCSGRPAYAANAYQANFGDSIAVQSASPAITGDFVLTVFDLSDTAGAPLDSWFALDRWSHPSWTAANLGSIFGLAVDGDGAIYATATRSWWLDIAGPAGWGGVYRIDPVSGAISTFATLPNTGAGLGNIAFDCDRNQFFVTNFEDGKIYRLSMSGAVIGTFDPGAPFNGSAPVADGDRPYAVEAHQGRLFYSMWNDDQLSPSAVVANEIWSVELDATGACMPGTELLEVSLPVYQGDWSSPVSDIRFSPRGTMLLAERTTSGIHGMGAHEARLLEYECIDGAWTESLNLFDVGEILQSCSGGVDCTADRNWVSADAMHLGFGDNMYGFQGIPATGGSIVDSILIDYQDNLTNQDKTLLGDLVVVETQASPVDCPILQGLHLECSSSAAPWTWDVTIGVSNMDLSGTITQVELSGPSGVTLSPSVFAMNLTPQHSWSVTSELAGAANGSTVCLDVIVTFDHGATCEDVICIDLPTCTNTVPGDLDFDGDVDIEDLLRLLGAFGTDCPDGCIEDLDGDGTVSVNDLLMLVGAWG
ncbi:MAG: hypothetical protein MK101_03250 [Phycisphaerales bacterium]|nr:hypothetical protein [Phycisphaerales bacterium]